MFRKKRKRKRFKFTIKKTTIFLILVVVGLFFSTKLYFSPPVMAYAKQKSYYYSSILINDAITKQIVPNIKTDELLKINLKTNGHVSSVVMDMHQVNDLLSKLTRQIQEELIKLENDGGNDLNNMRIPIGVMFDNPLLNHIGPNLNIQLKMVGSVHTDVISTVKPYGINNSLIKVFIQTKVRFQVIIPFQRGEIEVVTNTPLVIEIVQGSVPHYYYSGGTGSFSNPPRDDTNEPTPPENDIITD